MKTKNNHFGFTLIELLLVISMFVLLAVLSASALTVARNIITLNNDAREIINALRLAQNNSVISLAGARHGIYFKNNSYIVFAGEWANPLSSNEYSLHPGINFYNSADKLVIFDRLSGATSPVNIFIGKNETQKKEITIDALGNVFLKN